MSLIPGLDVAKGALLAAAAVALMGAGAIGAETFEHTTPWGLSAQLKAKADALDSLTAKDITDVHNSDGWEALDKQCAAAASATAKTSADAISAAATAAATAGGHDYDVGFRAGQILCPKGPPNAKAPAAPGAPVPPGVRNAQGHDFADDFGAAAH